MPGKLHSAVRSPAARSTSLNRKFVFGATQDRWWRRALLYATIVVDGGAVVSAIAVATMHALGIPVMLAKLGAIGIVLITWTYPMSARVVFRVRDAT